MSTIEDGFGGAWDSVCPTCEEDSMSVVRPGKVQCDSETCFYLGQYEDWLHNHPCSVEELWKIQNMLGSVFGWEHPLHQAAKRDWEVERFINPPPPLV